MRHAILGYKSTDISAFLENIIFIELKSRGYKVSVGKFDNFEIDFVAENYEGIKTMNITDFLLSDDF